MVSFFSEFMLAVAEQVIDVPKITLQDGFLQRAVPEQSVDVPTVFLSSSRPMTFQAFVVHLAMEFFMVSSHNRISLRLPSRS